MAAKAKDIDWDKMESAWRAGIVSVLSLQKEYGITRKAISDHWHRLGVPRNLNSQIKDKAESIVTLAMVTPQGNTNVTDRKISDKEIIEVNANIQATVILEEREDVKRLTRICEALEKQLESIAVDPDSEEDLEKKARINKTLIDSRDKVFNMRRRNYGINDNANGDANSDISSQNIEDVRREREEIRRRNGL